MAIHVFSLRKAPNNKYDWDLHFFNVVINHSTKQLSKDLFVYIGEPMIVPKTGN
jgi:hypothetical protein